MARTKSQYDIQQLRHAAHIAARVVDALGALVQPGVSAAELEAKAREICQEEGVVSSFYQYEGYPYYTCISVNDEVLHAMPHESKVFQEGDLVKVDFGVKYNGYCSDHCRTFAAGKISEAHARLLQVGEAATANAVRLVKAGGRIGDLGHAMQSTAEDAGFSIVKMYVGHGIGKKLHEPPEVPAFGTAGTGEVLQENMVICVECQVCEKSEDLEQDRDGWTVRTRDGGYSVMFESMVLVTKHGVEILSQVQ